MAYNQDLLYTEYTQKQTVTSTRSLQTTDNSYVTPFNAKTRHSFSSFNISLKSPPTLANAYTHDYLCRRRISLSSVTTLVGPFHGIHSGRT